MEGCEKTTPLCRVGRTMNLLKQVEPLKQAALQASSLQRHAHHAASRLTWVNIGSTSLPPSRAKQGTRTLGPILSVLAAGFKVCAKKRGCQVPGAMVPGAWCWCSVPVVCARH